MPVCSPSSFALSFLLAAALLSPASFLSASAVEPPFVRVPPIRQPIVVDGRISPGEWEGAFSGTGVVAYKRGGVEPIAVRYRFAYDDARVYMGLEMETPEEAALDIPPRRLLRPKHQTRFELLLDPKSGHPDTSWVQGMFWPLGRYKNLGYNQRIGGFVPYNVEWTYRDEWKDNVWTLEMSAPLSAFDRGSLKAGEVWGFLPGGTVGNGPGYISGQMGDSYSAREKFLKMVLDPEAPVIEIDGFDRVEASGVKPQVVIAHRGEKKGRYQVRFEYREGEGQDFSRSFNPAAPALKSETVNITISPGEKGRAGWDLPLPADKGQDGWVTMLVTGETPEKIYYHGSYKLGRLRTPKWTVKEGREETPDVLLAVHPYPSIGLLNVVLDYGGLRELPSRAIVKLKGAEGRVLATASQGASRDRKDLDASLPLPGDLPVGDYLVEARLLDQNGRPLRTLSSPYKHQRFAFEGNQLGVSGRVLYPWTPIKVDAGEKTLSVWNRRYRLSPNGFPEQITTQGAEILSGPIRIVERQGNLSTPLTGDHLEITETGEAKVTARAHARGKEVEAEIRVLAEYDGMLKYEVTLNGKKGERLDALDLIIPLKEEHAGFLHATGDGCRSNYSHALPEGSGVVWDSRRIVNWVMPVQWLPYLWLGDTERGLCWWADSAEGWTLPRSADQPVVRIEREKGRVQAVLPLITPGATVLWKDEVPRRIVFALEATPVRPRPAWARDIGLNDAKITHQKGPRFTWLGSAHWATYGEAPTPYSFAYLRPVSENAAEELRKRARQSEKEGRDLLLYTDMRSRALVGEEEKAFAWEWNPSQEEPMVETIRNARHYQGIPVNATPSRIEYDLWCLNKLMDLGARAFYFDEVQAEGQINPIAGLGYRDEDGRWMPTMRLFAYRELWKRLYTLMQDRGFKEPVIILHNTSTTYAGPMAFATATWDFEEANTDPNQRQLTKFGIDYLITEAMGHQYGFAASTLGPSPGFERWIKPGDAVSERHAARHWMGVHMILDMNPYLRAHPVLEEGLSVLGGFGWNQPGTEWIPYWMGQREELFTLQPGTAERQYATLYRRGNNGLLILLNDTNRDADLLWKPGKALKVKDALKEINPGSAIVQPEEGGYRVTVPRYDYRAFHVNLD